ncbi:MAG: MAPEG family protein [Spongiibacteraceae bacterium]
MLLIIACFAMVMLVMIVGMRMYYVRVDEMKTNRINPQSIATSAQAASQLKNTQAADNFKNLFEVPVLFYALVAVALAVGDVPFWLVIGAWSFVALRYIHSFIQCTYNKVMHRFYAFVSSFLLINAMWIGFIVSLSGRFSG